MPVKFKQTSKTRSQGPQPTPQPPSMTGQRPGYATFNPAYGTNYRPGNYGNDVGASSPYRDTTAQSGFTGWRTNYANLPWYITNPPAVPPTYNPSNTGGSTGASGGGTSGASGASTGGSTTSTYGLNPDQTYSAKGAYNRNTNPVPQGWRGSAGQGNQTWYTDQYGNKQWNYAPGAWTTGWNRQTYSLTNDRGRRRTGSSNYDFTPKQERALNAQGNWRIDYSPGGAPWSANPRTATTSEGTGTGSGTGTIWGPNYGSGYSSSTPSWLQNMAASLVNWRAR